MRERGSGFLRFCDYAVGIPLTFPAALYRYLTRPSPEKEIKKIGIFCPGAIGDLILLSALIDGLHDKLPHARIEVTGSSANAGALPLLPWVSQYHAIPVTRPDLLVRHLAGKKYDLFIDACQWVRYGNLASNLSSAAITVGFDTPGQIRGAGYDKKVPHNSNIHEVENFMALGRVFWPDLAGEVKLDIPDSSSDWTGSVVCHMWPAPGKGRHLKLWPEKHWVELVKCFLGMGLEVVFTGSRADASSTCKFMIDNFQRGEKVRCAAGQLSLVELASGLQNCQGLISINTGIMHLGAACNAAVIGLHGPTNPSRWGPVGKYARSLVPAEGHNCYLNLGFEYPRNAKNNMRHISVAAVLENFASLKSEKASAERI